MVTHNYVIFRHNKYNYMVNFYVGVCEISILYDKTILKKLKEFQHNV